MNYQEFSQHIIDKGMSISKSPPTLVGDQAKTMKVKMAIRRKRGNALIAECFYTFRPDDVKNVTWYDGFFGVKTPEKLIDLIVSIA